MIPESEVGKLWREAPLRGCTPAHIAVPKLPRQAAICAGSTRRQMDSQKLLRNSRRDWPQGPSTLSGKQGRCTNNHSK